MQEAPVQHQGRAVKRIREILGVKQEALAIELGMSQQTVSRIEEKERLEVDILQQVANALNVPVDAILNFKEEAAMNFIANNYNDNAANTVNYYCSINPVDKLFESLETNHRLYEQLLKIEREKTELLQRLLDTEREKVEMLSKKDR